MPMSPQEHKIRIAAVINDLLIGGAQSILLNLITQINPDEFTYSVAYIYDHAKDGRPDFTKAFTEAGVLPVNLGQGKKRHYFTAFWRLYRYVSAEKPDILHLMLPDAVILSIFAGRLAGVRSIVIHEMNTHSFYSKKLRFLFKVARNLADLTITYSETLEDELFGNHVALTAPITKLSRRSYTIYNGVDLDKVDAAKRATSFADKRHELGVAENAVLIFSAARLIPWKGFEYLVRAMPKVMAACPNAILLIAGEGEQEPLLRSLISEYGLEDRIRLLGPRQDVFEILAVSDIYPQAYSFPPGFSTISISMAGMEAMAFGLPPVVSKYPELYDHIEDKENAMLVEPRNLDEIAGALITLVNDKAMRERIGRGARRFVEDYFSSSKIMLIYESVYRALVERYSRTVYGI